MLDYTVGAYVMMVGPLLVVNARSMNLASLSLQGWPPSCTRPRVNLDYTVGEFVMMVGPTLFASYVFVRPVSHMPLYT